MFVIWRVGVIYECQVSSLLSTLLTTFTAKGLISCTEELAFIPKWLQRLSKKHTSLSHCIIESMELMPTGGLLVIADLAARVVT